MTTLKRICGALAVVGLLSMLAADGHAEKRWVWEPVKWRSTLTSSTTPTFASIHGSGANIGAKYVDSTYFSGIGTAVVFDTTAMFDLDYLEPMFSRDTTSAYLDTTVVLVFSMYPMGSGNADFAGADSSLVDLEATMNGIDWINLGIANSDSTRMSENVSASATYIAHFKSDFADQAATDARTWFGPWKGYRIVVRGYPSGYLRGKIGYWADIPEGDRRASERFRQD